MDREPPRNRVSSVPFGDEQLKYEDADRARGR